jgi:hypothetical protein
MPAARSRSLYYKALVALTAALLAPAALAQNGAGDYQAKLAQYQQARQAYEEEAEAYWNAVVQKRKLRNAKRRDHIAIALNDYVLTQPPLYAGPPRPIDPNAPGPPPEEKPPIPVIADFLKAAAEQYGFAPQLPASEMDFKRAYAQAARAAGLTREQIVGVYAFETGGTGTYDKQAGVRPNRPRAISPAIGYNQLLSTNTVSLFAENGPHFLAALERKAKTLAGAPRQQFEHKLAILRRMIAYCRSLPPRWSEYDEIAKHTAKGWGIHAAILDIDIGPLLQVQKLLDSVRFARAKGYSVPLTAAELELMNLTGDGNGFDMVLMPQAMRDKVPTSNFFQQMGYERNPVARRTATVAGLIADMQAQMTRGAQALGAKDLAAAF